MTTPQENATAELLPPVSQEASSPEIREIADTNGIRQTILSNIRDRIAKSPGDIDPDLIGLALKVADSIDTNAATRARIRIQTQSNENQSNHLALIQAYLTSPHAVVQNPPTPAVPVIPVFTPPPAVIDAPFNPSEFAPSQAENYEAFTQRMANKTQK